MDKTNIKQLCFIRLMRLVNDANLFAFFGGHNCGFTSLERPVGAKDLSGGFSIDDRIRGSEERVVFGTACGFSENALDYVSNDGFFERGQIVFPQTMVPEGTYGFTDFFAYSFSDKLLGKWLYFVTFEDGREFGGTCGYVDKLNELATATQGKGAYLFPK